MEFTTIKVRIANLEHRRERRDHIIAEFSGKDEFLPAIIPAIESPIGAMGLWMTLQHILIVEDTDNTSFFIFCEDDHKFTRYYSKDGLFQAIQDAIALNADILVGGVSWFQKAIPVSKTLFWVEKFSGLQFIVIFRKFYRTLIDAPFTKGNAADYKISGLTKNKFVIFPFISEQKEFGYSDVTCSNNKEGYVEKIFKESFARLELLGRIDLFFKARDLSALNLSSYRDISIPAYIITKSKAKLNSLTLQFKDKAEFSVNGIVSGHLSAGADEKWLGIVKAVRSASQKEEDMIVICFERHKFVPEYNKEFLMQNIITAGFCGCDLLLGDVISFKRSIPVTKNLFWLDSFYGAQFIVVYKKIYTKILNIKFRKGDSIDEQLSNISNTKLVLFPYISTGNFEELKVYQEIYLKYSKGRR
jgi:hypothetical protein